MISSPTRATGAGLFKAFLSVHRAGLGVFSRGQDHVGVSVSLAGQRRSRALGAGRRHLARRRCWLQRQIRRRQAGIGRLAGGGRLLQADRRVDRGGVPGAPAPAAGGSAGYRRIGRWHRLGRFEAALDRPEVALWPTPADRAGAAAPPRDVDGLAVDLTGGSSGIGGIRSGSGPSSGSALRLGGWARRPGCRDRTGRRRGHRRVDATGRQSGEARGPGRGVRRAEGNASGVGAR